MVKVARVACSATRFSATQNRPTGENLCAEPRARYTRRCLRGPRTTLLAALFGTAGSLATLQHPPTVALPGAGSLGCHSVSGGCRQLWDNVELVGRRHRSTDLTGRQVALAPVQGTSTIRRGLGLIALPAAALVRDHPTVAASRCCNCARSARRAAFQRAAALPPFRRAPSG